MLGVYFRACLQDYTPACTCLQAGIGADQYGSLFLCINIVTYFGHQYGDLLWASIWWPILGINMVAYFGHQYGGYFGHQYGGLFLGINIVTYFGH